MNIINILLNTISVFGWIFLIVGGSLLSPIAGMTILIFLLSCHIYMAKTEKSLVGILQIIGALGLVAYGLTVAVREPDKLDFLPVLAIIILVITLIVWLSDYTNDDNYTVTSSPYSPKNTPDRGDFISVNLLEPTPALDEMYRREAQERNARDAKDARISKLEYEKSYLNHAFDETSVYGNIAKDNVDDELRSLRGY